MTAEELAVKMEMGNYDWADEAAAKLRQQQAEIEELKTIRGNSVLVPSDKLQAMQAEIEALKKQLEKDVTDGIHKNLMSLYDKKASEK